MSQTTPSREPVGRGRLVFILDDQEGVRASMRRILEIYGFRVLEAENAHAALDMLRTDPSPVDLFICDLVLPGLGGREAANALLARRPDARVLFTSGFSSHDSFRNTMVEDGVPFLAKPFGVPELLNAVKGILDG